MGNLYPFSGCHCTRGYVKRRRTLFGRAKDTWLSGVVRRLCRRLHPIRKSQDLVEAIPTSLENRTACAGAMGADSWELQFFVQRLQSHSKDEGHWHCKTCSEIQLFGATPNRLRTNQQLSFSNHHVQDVCSQRPTISILSEFSVVPCLVQVSGPTYGNMIKAFGQVQDVQSVPRWRDVPSWGCGSTNHFRRFFFDRMI